MEILLNFGKIFHICAKFINRQTGIVASHAKILTKNLGTTDAVGTTKGFLAPELMVTFLAAWEKRIIGTVQFPKIRHCASTPSATGQAKCSGPINWDHSFVSDQCLDWEICLGKVLLSKLTGFGPQHLGNWPQTNRP